MKNTDSQEALDIIERNLPIWFCGLVHILQIAIDELKLYKKAHEIALRIAKNPDLNYDDEISFMEYCLDEARKELAKGELNENQKK